MRLSERNKQILKYSLLDGEKTIYKYDANGNKVIDYVDSDGTPYYLESGKRLTYTDPKEIKVNIAFSGGEVRSVEFGVDVTSYDATVIYLLKQFPITETSLIWYESEPIFKDGYVDPNSADYKVLSVKHSKNFTKLLLGKLAK